MSIAKTGDFVASYARGTCVILLGLSFKLGAVEVVVPPIDMALDGYLREWGPAERIPISPGGKQIGLRGVFRDDGDHEADAFAMWDATYLYFAVAVSDDEIDIGRVRPEDKIWHGPKGERKDRMFYFDHLKLFVRAQGAVLGYHVWVAPKFGDLPPYAWGNQQRQPGSEEVPVLLGSEQIESVYTFEVAIPWSWLGITPTAGMYLRSSILLVDSDLPGIEVSDKISSDRDKWIWWDGDLKLTGELPQPAVDPAVAAASAGEKEEVRDQDGTPDSEQVAEGTPRSSTHAPEPSAREDTASIGEEEPPTTRRDPTRVPLRRRFETALRSEQPVRPELPEWIRQIRRDPDLQEAQVVSYIHTIRKTLARLVRGRTTAHTRVIIIDMAQDAGTMKFLAREFVLGLLVATQAQLEESGSDFVSTVTAAAAAIGVEEGRALQFVRAAIARTYERLEKEKKTTTEEIIAHATKQSGLGREQANELLDILFSFE